MGTIIITDRTGDTCTLTGVDRKMFDIVTRTARDDEDMTLDNPENGKALYFAPGTIIKAEWIPEDQEPTPAPVPARTITDNPQA